jgi:hypothetical protein
VLLFSSFPFDPAQPHLVVMDSHLKVLATFTNSDFLVMTASYLGGQTVMTDVNGQVIVGNFRFDALPSGFSFSAVNPATLYSPSVSGSPAYNYNETNFAIVNFPPLQLQYQEFDSTWVPTGLFTTPLGAPSPAPASLRLQSVFSDIDSAAAPDVFVFQDDPDQRTYFLRVPKVEIDGGLSLVAPDLFTYAAANYPALVVKSDLDSQTISYSRAGMIAFEHQSEALVRFTLDAPDTVSSMPVQWTNGMRVAAGISGTWCVIWDPGTRMLTRYEQWW